MKVNFTIDKDGETIKRKVKIDYHDIWSMDYTLSFIIHPMLVLLKEKKHGYPWVKDEDVPDGIGLRSTEAPPIVNDWDWDENAEKRWEWVLDEMIWAFAEIKDGNDQLQTTDTDVYYNRLDNALLLFGKYFRALWD